MERKCLYQPFFFWGGRGLEAGALPFWHTLLPTLTQALTSYSLIYLCSHLSTYALTHLPIGASSLITHAHLHLDTYIYISTHLHLHTYIYTSTSTHLHLHTYIYTPISTPLHLHIYTPISTHLYLHLYIYTPISTHLHLHLYIYTPTSTHLYLLSQLNHYYPPFFSFFPQSLVMHPSTHCAFSFRFRGGRGIRGGFQGPRGMNQRRGYQGPRNFRGPRGKHLHDIPW